MDFPDAVLALEDEHALTIEDRNHSEARLKTLGMGPLLNVLFVVDAERGPDRIRIISARKADSREAEQYFQGSSHE